MILFFNNNIKKLIYMFYISNNLIFILLNLVFYINFIYMHLVKRVTGYQVVMYVE